MSTHVIMQESTYAGIHLLLKTLSNQRTFVRDGKWQRLNSECSKPITITHRNKTQQSLKNKEYTQV